MQQQPIHPREVAAGVHVEARQSRPRMRHSFVAAVLCLAAAVLPAAGNEVSAGTITISSPWARATPKGVTVGAAYMTITNNGPDTDILIGGTSAAVKRFEVHRTSTHDGVTMMRPVEGGLEIKPGETVVLKPESIHIMLIGLKEPLGEGSIIAATLEFARAGKVEVNYVVEAIGALSPPNPA